MSPDFALAAILLGILLVYAEFNLPGKVVFGAAGSLALMLGLHALLAYPLDLHAALLIPLSVGVTMMELKLPTRGLLATIVLSYALSHVVAEQNVAGHVHLLAAIFLAAVFNGATVALGRIALLARRNKARGSSHWGSVTLSPPTNARPE